MYLSQGALTHENIQLLLKMANEVLGKYQHLGIDVSEFEVRYNPEDQFVEVLLKDKEK